MRIPFSVLRTAYRMAVDTVLDNLTNVGEDYTIRDYWPACVALALDDAGMTVRP